MQNLKDTIKTLKANASVLIQDISLEKNRKKNNEVIRIPISILKRDEEPFVTLNPVDEAQRARLVESFRTNGYMKSNPVLVWRLRRNGKWEYILIDGFSRCAVLEGMGESDVWANIQEYSSLDEAVTAARYQEYSRRHDDTKSLYQQFEKLNLTALKNQSGRLNEVVAKQLGISAHNAQKLLQINSKASDDVKSALRNGKISTASAFKTITQEKKYSTKNKAFMNGVHFCLDRIAENKSPDKILELADTYLEQEQEGKK